MSYLKRFWHFLKQDTWQSWAVSLLLMFVCIKLILFPLLSLSLGTPLPLVVVESCSMYHAVDFEAWWEQNALWYESKGIHKSDFDTFSFKNGLNKGDVIVVSGRSSPKLGDVIIFNADYTYPIIHRLIGMTPYSTKGDNNPGQLDKEQVIPADAVIGHSVARIPGLGWLKLVFFEPFRPDYEKGFCR